MSPDILSQHISIWITQYISWSCLVSIIFWASGLFLWAKKWQRPVRDCSVYLVTIGVLTLVLMLRPSNHDVFLWSPLTWFCFTMLIIMELLWISFLFEALIRAVRKVPDWYHQRMVGEMPSGSGYPRS